MALAAATVATCTAVAYAQPAEPVRPVVVEMFLSQSCKSCPPAAAYLAEMGGRADVVALGWHIDYWNLLSSRKFGRWQDPFSRASFADRQRKYNRRIRSRSTVFTPQAIINGDESAIGSKREVVEELIEKAKGVAPVAAIDLKPQNDVLAVRISSNSTDPCEALLVTFYKSSITDVRGGDNAGTRFEEANVVTDVARLGSVTRGASAFKAPAPTDGKGCAVLVQEVDQGRIVAARYCP